MFFRKPKFNIKDLTKNSPELSEVFHHRNQGIPKKDLLALLKRVQEKNIVLLIRPVEVLTKALHEQGRFPTKNFNIKGKSSSWGAWAGFIPIDQAYSKLNSSNPEKIKKANKEVQACIINKFAQAIHLTISEKRFQELQNKKFIFLQGQEDEYLRINCPRPPFISNKSELCYAKKINATEYALYTAEKKSFQVLADMHLNRPLIADYDLLAIFRTWKDFSQDNIRPNPDVTFRERHRRLSPIEQRRSMENEKNFYGREIPNLGNIAPETIKILSELNQALNKGDYLECIHHNDDAGSPASDPTANYPITALLPKLKGLPEIVLIDSAKEFVDFIEAIKQHEFRVEANPLWEQAVQLAAKEDFYQKIIRLEHLKNNPEILKNSLRDIFTAIGITDSTLIKEITYVVLLTIKHNIHIQFKDFFKSIKSCLLINSVLVSQWCNVLDKLLSKGLLTDDVFFQIQWLVTQLKEDIPGFSELSATIINFENFENLQQYQTKERLNELLSLAETCIHDNKLDKIKFKAGINEGLLKLSLETTEELTASMLFKL